MPGSLLGTTLCPGVFLFGTEAAALHVCLTPRPVPRASNMAPHGATPKDLATGAQQYQLLPDVLRLC